MVSSKLATRLQTGNRPPFPWGLFAFNVLLEGSQQISRLDWLGPKITNLSILGYLGK